MQRHLRPLFFLTLSSFAFCSYVTQKDKHYFDYFLHREAAQLFHTKQFTLTKAKAIYGFDDIDRVYLSFSCFRTLGVKEARKLLLDTVNEILDVINNDPILIEKRMLKGGHFCAKDLHIEITSENIFAKDCDNSGAVKCTTLDDLEITYTTFQSSVFYTYGQKKFHESYMDASLLVARDTGTGAGIELALSLQRKLESAKAAKARRKLELEKVHFPPHRYDLENFSVLQTGKPRFEPSLSVFQTLNAISPMIPAPVAPQPPEMPVQSAPEAAPATPAPENTEELPKDALPPQEPETPEVVAPQKEPTTEESVTKPATESQPEPMPELPTSLPPAPSPEVDELLVQPKKMRKKVSESAPVQAPEVVEKTTPETIPAPENLEESLPKEVQENVPATSKEVQPAPLKEVPEVPPEPETKATMAPEEPIEAPQPEPEAQKSSEQEPVQKEPIQELIEQPAATSSQEPAIPPVEEPAPTEQSATKESLPPSQELEIPEIPEGTPVKESIQEPIQPEVPKSLPEEIQPLVKEEQMVSPTVEAPKAEKKSEKKGLFKRLKSLVWKEKAPAPTVVAPKSEELPAPIEEQKQIEPEQVAPAAPREKKGFFQRIGSFFSSKKEVPAVEPVKAAAEPQIAPESHAAPTQESQQQPAEEEPVHDVEFEEEADSTLNHEEAPQPEENVEDSDEPSIEQQHMQHLEDRVQDLFPSK